MRDTASREKGDLMFYRALRALVVAGTALGLLAATAPAGRADRTEEQPDLSRVREATNAYHDVTVAEHHEYQHLLNCFDSSAGGMGQHYVQTGHLDATVDPLDPEAMVYQVRDNRLQLVAVEWIVPKAAWDGADRPSLFGQRFHDNAALGLWVLHAWIWRPNPNGMFTDYNPSVPACPGN